MKATCLSRFIFRCIITFGLLVLGGSEMVRGQNPPIPFAVGISYPTNGQIFTAPASIGIHPRVTDSNVVATIQYFAGTTDLGIVTNTKGILVTNFNTDNPFSLASTNIPGRHVA